MALIERAPAMAAVISERGHRISDRSRKLLARRNPQRRRRVAGYG
jgi:hypothetical protein